VIINIPLPKPKAPLKFFSKVHKPDVFVEFIFEEDQEWSTLIAHPITLSHAG
jgi:hypothetical protein